MQYLATLLPLAFLAAANPLERRGVGCEDNACLAAVTGSAALGDSSLRASHCSSFLATTVTPPAITVTTTLTGESSNSAWKRASVTVCPNEVPNYASACDTAGYSSACACFGYTNVLTTTIAATTTTKTVYVNPTGSCPSGGATSTVTVTTAAVTVTKATVTVTKAAVTVTVTTGSGSGSNSTTSGSGSSPTAPSGKCLSDTDATNIVNNFINLLEYTSYNGTQGAPGRGYHYNVSAITLDPAFVDISDSINFMAGFPLGSVTFANKTAFDYGQGVLQPEVSVTTLNIFHDCASITWRWVLYPFTGALPVTGINYMEINDSGLIQKNYAEFDNGAWLTNFGQKCAINPVLTPVTPPATKRSVVRRRF